jgi:PTH1 family peptidyl-tRNA hydrolase
MSFLSSFFSSVFHRVSLKQRNVPSASPQPNVTPEWLIIGLGNPGAKYAATRHNVGYMAMDQLLATRSLTLSPVHGKPAEVAYGDVEGTPVVFVRSTTYMNLSGEAVEAIAAEYSIPAERIVILHDELDLPLGKVRVKMGGNENGHNGLKSTTELLGTRDYLRVRMGISRPPKGMAVPDYVLGPVDTGEELSTMIITAAEAAELIVSQGLSKAQNLIHSRS